MQLHKMLTCLLQKVLVWPLQLLLPSTLLQQHYLTSHCPTQLQQLLPALLPCYSLTL
jgi:hypothetical protein